VLEADIVALKLRLRLVVGTGRSLGCAHRFVPRGSGSMETLTDGRGRNQPARGLRHR